jgi:hypothetical protein
MTSVVETESPSHLADPTPVEKPVRHEGDPADPLASRFGAFGLGLALVVLVGSFVAIIAGSEAFGSAEQLEIGKAAPNFSLRDVQGTQLTLDDLQTLNGGLPVLLVFDERPLVPTAGLHVVHVVTDMDAARRVTDGSLVLVDPDFRAHDQYGLDAGQGRAVLIDEGVVEGIGVADLLLADAAE